MWSKFADIILHYRKTFLWFIGLSTLIMGYLGTKVEIFQEFVKVVPADDPDFIQYQQFKKTFGEDGNALIIGIEASHKLFEPTFFQELKQLSDSINQLEGIQKVTNYTQLPELYRNDSLRNFEIKTLFHDTTSLQSIQQKILNHPFYRQYIFDSSYTTTVCALTLTNEILNSKKKHKLLWDSMNRFEDLGKKHGVKIHFAGLPYVRTYNAQKLPQELALFMVLATVVTAVTLFLFYRSWMPVIFPMLTIALTAAWSLGLITLFGYKITILTALLPPLLVIIGIPNSVYMMSDYHEEFVKLGSKEAALKAMIKKLGMVTLMINANTAFGFLTLYFTSVVVLQQFGIIAFLGTMITYFLTIIMLPGIFSLLPDPTYKTTKHLDAKRLNQIIESIAQLVKNHKKAIYIVSVTLSIIGTIGIFRLYAVSYMVDDLPSEANIMKDLRFMEEKFNGVFPYEIIIDTQKKNGLKNYNTLKKIEKLQNELEKLPELSNGISIINLLKLSRYAYFGNQPEQYTFPTKDELAFITDYSRNTNPKSQNNLLDALADSLNQKARLQFYVKDIGSQKIPTLIAQTDSIIQTIFPKEGKIQTHITGTTKLFLKANEYLVDNLYWSLLATFLIIGLQMFVLFWSWRIMIISLLVNLIPLIVTAGLMGYGGIPLKPSTALIYGIAFGIAIDNSIHLLAMYWNRRKHGESIPDAIYTSIKRTGMSIIYTSSILLAGFIIFTPSAFGSTRALGVLTSMTLFIALFSNLILLPALVEQFDVPSTKEELASGWINEENLAVDDEDNEVTLKP